MKPKMSAEAQINGAFDYNITLLAPPGIKAVIYEKPGSRITWDLKITKRWYIGAH